MNQQIPQEPTRTGTRPSLLWAISGGLVFVILHQMTDGKVPGGVIGGAIGGVLGALLGLAINSVRRR